MPRGPRELFFFLRVHATFQLNLPFLSSWNVTGYRRHINLAKPRQPSHFLPAIPSSAASLHGTLFSLPPRKASDDLCPQAPDIVVLDGPCIVATVACKISLRCPRVNAMSLVQK